MSEKKHHKHHDDEEGHDDIIENHGEHEHKEHDNTKHDEAKKAKEKEIEKLKQQIEELAAVKDQYLDKYQRAAAEFENYKRRTTKEKQCLYTDTTVEVLGALLPVLDNLERAIETEDKDDNLEAFKEGVTLIFKQFKQILKEFGVEEIDCVGKVFDPELHNAVMHVEDEKEGSNVVTEQLCKGYKINDKVIRHSMVKVAN